ncbi:hypothetical protein ACT691_20395 [Vibrio metschnikovii]
MMIEKLLSAYPLTADDKVAVLLNNLGGVSNLEMSLLTRDLCHSFSCALNPILSGSSALDDGVGHERLLSLVIAFEPATGNGITGPNRSQQLANAISGQ